MVPRISQQRVEDGRLRRKIAENCINGSAVEVIDDSFRCDSHECRVVIGYAGDGKNFFAHGPIAAAFSAEPNALALELRKIGQRVAYREKPKNLMVDTTERHQVRCEPAVRNAPLHKSDLNAGIRIIQQSEVFFRATGLAQIHLNSGPRQYALIAGAENVVMLTLRRGRDCDLRRWGWNEIRHSKPGENGDTQYRRRYLEDVPTCNTQHERFRSPTR